MTPVFFVAALVWALLIALPVSVIAVVIGKRKGTADASIRGWDIFRRWFGWSFVTVGALLFLVFSSVPVGRP